MNDVCVFGGCSQDLIFYQKPDGTYSDLPDIRVPGGKGANQALAASRAGAKTTIISRLGNDEIGRNIVDNLKNNGIDVSHIEMVDNLENDYSTIKVNIADKDNEIERFSGAINSFTPDMIEKYSDVILQSKIIVCQLKVPKEVTEMLINFCYDHGKTLILTPCRPEKLSISDPHNIELINKISLITCNQKECQTIFNTDDIESCVKKYPNKLIVTLGKDGLIYYNGERLIRMPSINVLVKDTVGAGDTLNGNLAALLASGLDLQHALRKSMYASALKIQVQSAQAGMPYKEDLEQFIFEHRSKFFKYNSELSLAMQIVKEANQFIQSNQILNVSTKEDNSLVTNLDIEVENLLISKIKEKFPNDAFLTEEHNPDNSLQDRLWIIDPIDGTAHFIKGTPFWGIQLAFFDKNKTRFSIIYLPTTNELYYAIENQGAYVNGNKILPAKALPLEQCMVEFGGCIYKELASKKIYFSKLVKSNKLMVSNLFHVNSCCISFTNLASRKTDALIIASKKPWDVIPGMLLCKEAGIDSYILDFNGNLKLYTSNEGLRDLIVS